MVSIGETWVKELSRTKGEYDHILTTAGNLEKNYWKCQKQIQEEVSKVNLVGFLQYAQG